MHISPLSRTSLNPISYLYNRPQVMPSFTPPEGRDTYIPQRAFSNGTMTFEEMLAFDRAKLGFWNRDTGQLPKLEEVKEDIEAMDFSSMSKGEIYGALFDRFAETFGEDFQCLPRLSSDDCKIMESYSGYVREYIGDFVGETNDDRIAAYREWKGYSGSKDDVRDAIMQKYDYGNNLTIRETMHMQSELYDAGLITNGEALQLYRSVGDHFLFIGDHNIGNLDSILNLKVDSASYFMEQIELNKGLDFAKESVDFLNYYLKNFCKKTPEDIAKRSKYYVGS